MLEFDELVCVDSFEVLLEIVLLSIIFDYPLLLLAKHVSFFVG